MNAFEHIPMHSSEHSEQETYHFKEIQEMETPMMILVDQLKENFEKGKYDVFISDETGGENTHIDFAKNL